MTNVEINAMMMKFALILFAVIGATIATPFLQLGDDDVLGDIDVDISVRGENKTLTYKTPNGNVLDVTHVLKGETINDVEGSLTCTERVAMTDEELSPWLAGICRGKAVSPEFVENMPAGQLAGAAVKVHAVESNVHGLFKGSCAEVWMSRTYCLSGTALIQYKVPNLTIRIFIAVFCSFGICSVLILLN
ncbi:hypothetical protein MAR_031648, partial [Mya arenaria]